MIDEALKDGISLVLTAVLVFVIPAIILVMLDKIPLIHKARIFIEDMVDGIYFKIRHKLKRIAWKRYRKLYRETYEEMKRNGEIK